MGINYFNYAGKNSTDFGVWISGESTYTSPEKDVDAVTIPGKNGTLTIDNGRFHNIAVPYPAFIIDNFERLVDDEDDIIICAIGTNNRHQYITETPLHTKEEHMKIFYSFWE